MKGTFLDRNFNHSKYRARRDTFFYISQGLKKIKAQSQISFLLEYFYIADNQ